MKENFHLKLSKLRIKIFINFMNLLLENRATSIPLYQASQIMVKTVFFIYHYF